ncbi:luciferin sulfotransferase-like [Uranotaenia lowii]|uniref:luciferin sulfotransferase-like n=1 Tax=Uranotaenia lowii TaxID=190385 RepID=UPI0024798BFC|nr:luciferin sulfotransferase-like [Uranotaenia lowii]
MAFEYIDIEDSVYKATFVERAEQGYILVRPKDYSHVPVSLPGWEPEPTLLNEKYKALDEPIKNMTIYPDDVWLATYPKSGTTWCQEMIWLICNDLNYTEAANVKLVKRFPFLELSGIRPLPQDFNPFEDAQNLARPRFIKTHLPVSMLPDQIWTIKPKLVYVRRNPKAVAPSYYHHSVSLHGYRGNLEQFVRSFINDLQYYSPYHRHVIEYNNLNYDNILQLCYEDMKKDLAQTLRRVCQFFGKSYTDQQLQTLEQHLSFDSMKNNEAVNSRYWVEFNLKQTNRIDKVADQDYQFIRRGEAAGWKRELSDELIEGIDEWTRTKVTDPNQAKLFRYD